MERFSPVDGFLVNKYWFENDEFLYHIICEIVVLRDKTIEKFDEIVVLVDVSFAKCETIVKFEEFSLIR